MSNYKISRRQFITAAGTIFTLPLLESLFPFSSKWAQAAGDPRRYVMIYFPDGTYNRSDKPIWAVQTGNLSAGNTSLALAPFANQYSDMISINRMFYHGWGHIVSSSCYLTGLPNRDENTPVPSNTISMDNLMADQFGKPGLVLSGGATDTLFEKAISFRNGVGNIGIDNPGDLYRLLLGQIVVTPQPAPSNDKSILDSTITDFSSFMSTLGATDRAKMDEFLTSIRQLEANAATMSSSASNCTSPTLDPALDGSNSEFSPTYDKNLYLPKFYAFNDLIKTAFACDVTRTVAIMVDYEATSRYFASAPPALMYNGADITGNQSHLGISHESALSVDGYNRCVTRDRTLFSIASDLASKLKSAVDPSGSSILDNTIIHTGFGVEDSNHMGISSSDIYHIQPCVLLGGKNIISGHGTAIDLSNYQLRDLLFTFAQRMGLNGISSFGGTTTQVPI